MKLYIADSFTNKIFSGNQAGVVLLEEDESFPEYSLMRSIAAELKHSETAFIKRLNESAFRLRYFTPEGEVDLCGHATVAAFTILRNEKGVAAGRYIAQTAAGELDVSLEADVTWLKMPEARLIKELSAEESEEVYKAYGLSPYNSAEALKPCVVSSGLTDILLPVKDRETLFKALQSREKVIEISKKHSVVGVHIYCPVLSGGVTALCRNFAPLFGINEEAATGTSNAGLTYYLHNAGLIKTNESNLFIQGESMGKPSQIRSRIDQGGSVWIGGGAVVSVEGSLRL